jgi:hypothetical protein
MRRQDAGYFDVGGFVYGSMAANYKSPFAPTGTRTVLVAGAAATPGADRYQLYVANNATLFYYMSAGVLRATGSVASTWPAQRRVSTWADSSAGLGYVSDGSNASSVPQSSTMVTTMDRVYVGMNPTATTVNNYGIISNVCVDPSWKRCR